MRALIRVDFRKIMPEERVEQYILILFPGGYRVHANPVVISFLLQIIVIQNDSVCIYGYDHGCGCDLGRMLWCDRMIRYDMT